MNAKAGSRNIDGSGTIEILSMDAVSGFALPPLSSKFISSTARGGDPKKPKSLNSNVSVPSVKVPEYKPAKGSTVTMTWYKTLDAIKSEKYEARDLVAMSTLELFGTWADSAQYRCLIEYSDPYIPPVWTEILAFAFVGLYRTSMYRYNLADKIALTKTTIDDLELSCYFQTSKRDTAPVAVWTTIEIGGTGAVLTPNGG